MPTQPCAIRPAVRAHRVRVCAFACACVCVSSDLHRWVRASPLSFVCAAVLSQVRKMGNDLKKVINQRYSHVEIDIDGIFKMILLLAKKKVCINAA